MPVGAIQSTRTEAGDQIQFRVPENESTTSLSLSTKGTANS
jgi:hypothetical protein